MISNAAFYEPARLLVAPLFLFKRAYISYFTSVLILQLAILQTRGLFTCLPLSNAPLYLFTLRVSSPMSCLFHSRFQGLLSVAILHFIAFIPVGFIEVEVENTETFVIETTQV